MTEPAHAHGRVPPRAEDDPLPSSQPAGTIRIGRLAGSDVLVSRSWFVVAALIAVVIAPQAELAQPGLGNWKYVAGLAFAVVLYLSVLLHEGAHAFMARRFGFPVTSITLHFLGGMTAIEGEARRPREEFWIAVVGPITSLAVGVLGLGAASFTDGGLIRMVLGGVAFSNLIIGILNLVPGLPLDGGRVLKSAVWGITGNVHRGTLIAGWCGRLLAVVALVTPLVLPTFTAWRPRLLDYVMAVIIAAFLWTGATAAMSSARIRRRLPSLVGRSLARATITVSEDTPLAEALRRAEEAQSPCILTATSSGLLVGVVNGSAVNAIPSERRPWVPVSSVARSIDASATLPAAISGEELILAISRRPAEEYLLVEADGSLVGVLVTADVDKAFRESRH
jgi:Zn-dependent protease/CBS domain-containing protein